MSVDVINAVNGSSKSVSSVQRVIGWCEITRKALNSSRSSGSEASRSRRVFPLQNPSAGIFLNESGTAAGLKSFRLLVEMRGFFIVNRNFYEGTDSFDS